MSAEQDGNTRKTKPLHKIILNIAVAVLLLIVVVLCALFVRNVFFSDRYNFDSKAARQEEIAMNEKAAKTTGGFVPQKIKPAKAVKQEVKKTIKSFEIDNTFGGLAYRPENVMFVPQQSIDWKARQDTFIVKTGFKGTIQRYEKPKPSKSGLHFRNCGKQYPGGKQNFQYMTGTFPLSVPNDTLLFMSNCDIIVDNIMQMYDSGGEEFSMEPDQLYFWKVQDYYGFNRSEYRVWYYQIFDGSRLLFNREDCSGIFIEYRTDENKYRITNNLFEYPLVLPMPQVSFDKVLQLAACSRAADRKTDLDTVKKAPVFIKRNIFVQYADDPYYYYADIVWSIFFGEKRGPCYNVNGTTGKILNKTNWMIGPWRKNS